MKRLILLIVFFNLYLVAYNQIIKGTILDKDKKNPVNFAYIYFNGSSTGTQSDLNGNFELDVSKNTPNPLTISAIGYYSAALTDYLTGKPLTVYLVPKIIELSEINVGAKSLAKKREANLKVFKNIFLGTTDNARYCEILNDSDIKFNYGSDKDTLKVFASKPLIINNRALGYEITYYLDKFEYKRNDKSFIFQGNVIFKKDLNLNETQRIIIEERRKNAYLGSRMHFFRALWLDELESSGFTVKNNFGRNLLTKEIIIQDANHKKYMNYKGSLGICYYSDVPFSHLEIQKDRIYFDKNGYFDSFGIIWEGYIAEQKIADMLPLEYILPEEQDKSERIFEGRDTMTIGHIKDESLQFIEKVYLHTDRDFYNPGDDIWFKSYVVDGLTHIPTDSSKNLHVELISPGSKIIDSRVIKLDNGLGNGDFALPDNLQSGKYRLRVYTNSMRNFGDQLFFNKEITIINGSDTAGVVTDDIKFTDSNLEISFFPEGGSLVDNVSSIIAYKAVNATGSGCDVSGEVFSSSGELITTFRSTHLGMGAFTLKPSPGSNYYAIVRNFEGDVIKVEIPKSFSKGFVLNARVSQMNEYSVTLKTNPETLPRFFGRDLLVTLSSHSKIIKTLTVKINAFINSFIIPIEKLPDGIIMVTLFDPDNNPLCERLIYVQNNDEVNVKIETDKTVYKQRDSISVKLSLTEYSGTGQEAFLSLSATENIYTDRASLFPSTISSWFLLESDVHGLVENPSYYFDPANPTRLKDLDLLLLTQGWRDFRWKFKELKYLPESGFTISGRLRKSLTNAPIKNALVTIGIFQSEKNIITTASTDSTGRFHFDLDNLTGSARVIVSAVDKKGNFQGRLILDSLGYSPAEVKESAISKIMKVKETQPESENITLLKETDAVKKSIRKKYTLSDTILIDEVQIIAKKKETPQEFHVNQSRMVYGQPDKEVIVSPQLESMRNIRDLLIGRVSGILFTNPANGSSGIIIRGAGSSLTLSDSDPLFLLDGLEVTYTYLSTIPLNWIDRVDVIKSEKAAAFGVRGANGVISVITKTYKDLPYKPVSHSVNAKISGYDAPRVFYSPKYPSTQQTDYRPDLRSTLYWFPDIKVIGNKDYVLKYYNADISSTYQIIVAGITSRGIPVTGKVEYEVR
jgi:hypothetical protein